MEQRLVQYDILKGIGILLVIICHAGLDGFLKDFIYTFHMPLFFFVSGCFFRDLKFEDYIVKNFKQLIIPYFLFLFTMVVVRNFRSLDVQSFMYSMISSLGSLDPLDESDRYMFESIWFLICLFNVRILYWLINKIFSGNLKYKLSVSLFLYVIGYTLQSMNVNIPLFIDTAFTVVVFFALGELFHKREYDAISIRWWIPFCCILFCLFGFICFESSVELKHNKFPFYLVLISVTMIFSLYNLSKGLMENNDRYISCLVTFLKKSGVSSLCILGFHNQLFWIIGHFLHNIPISPIIISFMMVFITVVAVFYIEKFFEKYLPFLLGKF